MPRKRASKTPQESTTVEESTRGQADSQAGNCEIPPETLATAPIGSLPASEATSGDDVPTFAQKHLSKSELGSRSQNFGIAGDYEAGVRLIENRRDQLMTLKFDQKPSHGVLAKLRDAGFRWHPRDEVWNRSIQPENARQTRIEAEKLFDDIRQAIRLERGLSEGQTLSV